MFGSTPPFEMVTSLSNASNSASLFIAYKKNKKIFSLTYKQCREVVAFLAQIETKTLLNQNHVIEKRYVRFKTKNY